MRGDQACPMCSGTRESTRNGSRQEEYVSLSGEHTGLHKVDVLVLSSVYYKKRLTSLKSCGYLTNRLFALVDKQKTVSSEPDGTRAHRPSGYLSPIHDGENREDEKKSVRFFGGPRRNSTFDQSGSRRSLGSVTLTHGTMKDGYAFDKNTHNLLKALQTCVCRTLAEEAQERFMQNTSLGNPTINEYTYSKKVCIFLLSVQYLCLAKSL
jgi:hypothetical protein